MSERNGCFLVECLSDVNLCIKKPLQQTLRIKFTTLDVSTNYFVFGATSGGIYIFNRSNYEFQKLVPTKEGAIVKLLICPEEKYVIVGTSKGCIILVEGCFSDINVKYQQFSEHEGNTITELIWQYHEVYCGDSKGKISVISLSSLLSKAIFQTPTAILMHLDSPIIQLDACGKYLLVSTRSKTYLCDTETEQYRQIGRKPRDGDFGACFFAEDPTQFIKNNDKEKTRFKFLREDETFSHSGSVVAKILCTRPGCRLWEADFGPKVVCTYQFKTALSENQTESICLDSDVNTRLKTRKMMLHNFDNFTRLYLVAKKFLITYSNSNLVVFDIQGIHLLFTYEMRDIKEVKIVQNYIYLWNKKDVRVIALMDLEYLLLKVLSAKQYLLCVELCVKYKEHVLKYLEISDRLHVIEILRDKCKSDNEMNCLEEIFKAILVYRETINNGRRKSQVVKVNNGHLEMNLQSLLVQPSCSYAVETNHKLETGIDKEMNNCAVINGKEELSPETEMQDIKQPVADRNYVNNILYKQYQVNKLYNQIETAQLHELLASKKNLDDIVTLFKDFVDYVKSDLQEDDNNNVLCWCYKQYLKYVSNNRDCVKSLDVDSMALKYIFEAFKFVNTNSRHCSCKFPLPLNDSKEEYYGIAKELYYKLTTTDREQLLQCIPLLWALKLGELKDPLPVILQLGSRSLFKSHCESFNYDQWCDCVILLAKLKRGYCLNCERRQEFDSSHVFTWKELAMIMLKRIGGLETTKILKKYARFIPNEELGYEFYQACLFSAASKENGKSCDFMTNILTTPCLEVQFENGLQQYLSQKYLGIKESDFMILDHLESDRVSVDCSLCNLRIKNPVLDANTRLSCGHFFHKLCLESVNGICRHCVQLPS